MVMHSSELDPNERTFIMVKPDLVRRGLVNKIMKRFETRGYRLVGLKQIRPTTAQLEAHYEDLKGQHFFDGLIDYMNSGPVVAMVWEGVDAARQGRRMLGLTNPLESAPGTIRADFCLQSEARKVCHDNICHGSDCASAAEREIRIWFRSEELMDYRPKSRAASVHKVAPAELSAAVAAATAAVGAPPKKSSIVSAVTTTVAPVAADQQQLSNCKLSHERALCEFAAGGLNNELMNAMHH